MSQFVELAIKRSEKKEDLVEVGVFNGHSARIIHELILQSTKKLSLHLFDSFEGLSDFNPKDKEGSSIKDDNQDSGNLNANLDIPTCLRKHAD